MQQAVADLPRPVDTIPTCETVLVDAHVHIYDCYDLVEFFEAADRNFRLVARECELPSTTPGVLMLAETANDQYFERLVQSGNTPTGSWTFHHTEESCSLVARQSGEPCLIVVAGRQIVTQERLEVLALGCRDGFADGRPIRKVIKAVASSGAIAVVPWGFGKWWGKRGRLVRELLHSDFARHFYLGDNSGRPMLSARPKLMKRAGELSVGVLPGSDPLPFAAQAVNAGRYGVVLGGTFDWAQPVASIKSMLTGAGCTLKPFGRRETLLRFFRYQTAMQLRKHRYSTIPAVLPDYHHTPSSS